MKNLINYYSPIKQKILYYFTQKEYEKGTKQKNSKFNCLKLKHPQGWIHVCEEEEILLKNLLNFSRVSINYIVEQEIKNLNASKEQLEQSDFFYEILYLGLQTNILSWQEIKDILPLFYKRGRINKNQYNTLIYQYYLEEREYEEKQRQEDE